MVVLRDEKWAMYYKPESAMYYVIYHQHTDKQGIWLGTLVDGNGDMLLSHDKDDRQTAKYCMYCSEEAPAWMLGFQRLCKWER